MKAHRFFFARQYLPIIRKVEDVGTLMESVAYVSVYECDSISELADLVSEGEGKLNLECSHCKRKPSFTNDIIDSPLVILVSNLDIFTLGSYDPSAVLLPVNKFWVFPIIPPPPSLRPNCSPHYGIFTVLGAITFTSYFCIIWGHFGSMLFETTPPPPPPPLNGHITSTPPGARANV